MTTTSRTQPLPFFSDAPPIETSKNKIVLTVLSGFFGFLGADRFYMKCYKEGFAKLFLFLGGILFLFIHPLIGLLFLVLNIIWSIFDQLFIMYNAITESFFVPYTFCKSPGLRWSSPQDVKNARSFALFIILIEIVFFVYIRRTSLTVSSNNETFSP